LEKYVTNFMKIRPVGVEFSHADRRMDGQTDMMKVILREVQC